MFLELLFLKTILLIWAQQSGKNIYYLVLIMVIFGTLLSQILLLLQFHYYTSDNLIIVQPLFFHFVSVF